MDIRLKTNNTLFIIILILISLAVYANSLYGEYLIDDFSGIVGNTNIHNLGDFFAKHFSIRTGILSEAFRAICWHIGQGKPFVFHVFNVCMHAIFVVVLFKLLNIIFRNNTLSFLSSLIFAIHPIHTEAVSWISGGPYVLGGIFFVLSFIFYIKASSSKSALLLSVFTFLLGFLSNNSVLSLPLVLIIYELFFYKKEVADSALLLKLRRGLLLLYIVFSIIGIAGFLVNRKTFVHTIFFFKGSTYLVVVFKALVYYLKIIYMPIHRGLYHTFAYNTTDTNKLTPAFFVSIAIIIFSIWVFFKCLKKHKPISFAISFFYLTYLPYSNIIPICNIVSERYVYLASTGFCILVSYCFLEAWKLISNTDSKYKSCFRAFFMSALIIFIISYSTLTIKHNRNFKDIITYWDSNITNFPDGYMAYNNLAGTYYMMGEREQAKGYSWVNLMINPRQPHVWTNLAKLYREEGDFKMAKYCYEQAIEIDNGFFAAVQQLEELKKIMQKKELKESNRKIKAK